MLAQTKSILVKSEVIKNEAEIWGGTTSRWAMPFSAGESSLGKKIKSSVLEHKEMLIGQLSMHFQGPRKRLLLDVSSWGSLLYR